MAFKQDTRDFPFEIKQIDEKGRFEGWLSVFGELDDGGDVVEKGAFRKTLRENKGRFPLLWHHDQRVPVGDFEAEEKDKGLWISGQILQDEDVRQAKTAYALAKRGITKGLSIGYKTVRDEVRNGIRYLKEIKLFEGSLVTFPMLKSAQLMGIKSSGERKDFDETLARRRTLSAPDQMVMALWSVLDSVIYFSDLSADEALAAAEESIDQFRAAYLEMLPDLLDIVKSGAGFEEKTEMREKANVRAMLFARPDLLLETLDAVGTSPSAEDAEDSTVSTESKAADASEEAAADLMSELAEKLKPKADQAA